jgi:hypothetical protein
MCRQITPLNHLIQTIHGENALVLFGQQGEVWRTAAQKFQQRPISLATDTVATGTVGLKFTLPKVADATRRSTLREGRAAEQKSQQSHWQASRFAHVISPWW